MTRSGMARSAILALAAIAGLVVAPAAPAHARATVTITHQMRGCHMWQLGKRQSRASLNVTVDAGTMLKIVNTDVTPHKLIQTAGPKLRLRHANMNHMSASTAITLMKKGVYRFRTKAGADYPWMPEMKTAGKDYVLHMTIHVN